ELTLLISERTAGRFGLGLRYDSRYKASVLLSGAHGAVDLDARLGQQIRVGFGVAQALGDAQSLALDARVAYAHGPFDLFRAGRRSGRARRSAPRVARRRPTTSFSWAAPTAITCFPTARSPLRDYTCRSRAVVTSRRRSSAPSGRCPSLPTCSPACAGTPVRCSTAGRFSPRAGSTVSASSWAPGRWPAASA